MQNFRFSLATLLLGALFLSGCAYTKPTQLNVHDNSVLMPILIADGTKRRIDPGGKSTGPLISYSYASGISQQNLPSGEHITVNSGSIYGPTVLNHDYQVQKIALDFKVNGKFSDRLGYEYFGGVGYLDYAIEISSTAGNLRHSDAAAGLSGGGGLYFELPMGWVLRLRIEKLFSILAEDISSNENTILLEIPLLKNFEAVAGMRSWHIDYGAYGSDTEFKLSGPVLGLQYRFQ